MSARLRWQTAAGQGVFPLPQTPLHLLWTEGALDRVSQAPASGPLITVQPPDAEGRLELVARGEIEFVAGERAFRRVRLPLGGAVAFRAGATEGELVAEGEREAADPLIGRTLANYRILERIGSGSVGTVYRALQTNLDREVAVKVLDADAARDPAKEASFLREAQAAGRLVHPNIVQVYDVGEVDARTFYSMELMRGGSLEDRIQRAGPMPWREGIVAVRDCALALAFAEERHVLHRDVKPANLMVAESGHVKLADLGLAATRELMDREAAGGTPHFMAPEAATGGAVDARADLYSLGCTLYRLLTAQTPFSGATVKEILRAHRDQPPPTLRAAGVRVPPGVEDLVARLLAKDPAQRPASASEVVAACDGILAARSSKARAFGVAAVLAVAAGAVAWQALHKPAQKPPERRVEYVADPEAAAAQKRLAEVEVQSAFYQALAAPEEQRASALEAFLREHPSAPQAEQARAELERLFSLAAEPSGAEAPSQPGAEPSPVPALVEEHLRAGRQGAAWRALQALAADVPRRAALERRVEEAASTAMAAMEAEHAAALEAGDDALAAAVRERFAAAMGLSGAESDGAAPPAWRERLGFLEAAADLAARARREAAFRRARLDFLAVVQGPVLRALSALDAEAAGPPYAAAAAACPHQGLAAAALEEHPVLEAAARASRVFHARARGGDEVAIVEPLTGKRAVVVGSGADGLRIVVQVRGERVERLDPWDAYLQPEALSSLLRAVLPPEVDDEAACALYFLAAETHLAATLRSWGDRIPPPDEAARVGQEARMWLARLPRGLESEPSWLARHRALLEELADLAEALAAADGYLALVRLEGLLSRYSLLAAWASDGSCAFGLAP